MPDHQIVGRRFIVDLAKDASLSTGAMMRGRDLKEWPCSRLLGSQMRL